MRKSAITSTAFAFSLIGGVIPAGIDEVTVQAGG
jgi:hypothetical protein